ncbi:hypothetical protein [Pseudomonas fitomaticsae]|uniref:Cold shock domain-containing protein n=1 Tax=Pseudomonas fitomaticsae TaxID=2837969 RepID=A0ABY3Q140_9PSED|nr:hypothetical protein [Pseudomonas fitomaticsae]UFP99783.1 hypothetical protein KJY40_27885 [Pseudomonas fitomaticsae]
MEKQCVQRNEQLDPDTSLIFCISPGDPIIKHIKEGQKVTYDLVRGDNGQFYAVDIRLVQEEEIPNPIQTSAFLL